MKEELERIKVDMDLRALQGALADLDKLIDRYRRKTPAPSQDHTYVEWLYDNDLPDLQWLYSQLRCSVTQKCREIDQVLTNNI